MSNESSICIQLSAKFPRGNCNAILPLIAFFTKKGNILKKEWSIIEIVQDSDRISLLYFSHLIVGILDRLIRGIAIY